MIKIASVGWLFHGHNLLLIRKHGKDYFTPPGGHVEAGETIGQALMREMKEELNLVPRFVMTLDLPTNTDWYREPQPFFVQNQPSKHGGRGTALDFAGVVDDISQLKTEDAEIAEHKWFDMRAIEQAGLHEIIVARAKVAYELVQKHNLVK